MAEEKLNEIKQSILNDSHDVYKDYQLSYMNVFGEEEIFGMIMVRGELTENHPCFRADPRNYIYKKLLENPNKDYIMKWVTYPGMRFISEEELAKKYYA